MSKTALGAAAGADAVDGPDAGADADAVTDADARPDADAGADEDAGTDADAGAADTEAAPAMSFLGIPCFFKSEIVIAPNRPVPWMWEYSSPCSSATF